MITDNETVKGKEVAEQLGPPFYYDIKTEKLCGALAYCWLKGIDFPDEWANTQTNGTLKPTLKQFAQQLRFSKNDHGSANHYIARNVCRLIVGCLNNDKSTIRNAVDSINYYFTSQKMKGHLWFANRDETTTPGYTKLHIAFVALARMVNAHYDIDEDISDYSYDWLRSQNALFKALTANNGHIYMPGKKSQPYGKLVEPNIYECRYNREFDNIHSLLSTGTDREDEKFYEVTNDIGHPANLGSYIVREMLRRQYYIERIPNLEDDLPMLGHVLHILRTDKGFIAYYDRISNPVEDDWMHWSVRYMTNQKIALEVAEKGYAETPVTKLSQPDGGVKLRIALGQDERIIIEN